MNKDASYNDVVNIVQETMGDVIETLQVMQDTQKTCLDAAAELGFHIHDATKHCQVDERLTALESQSVEGVAYNGGATVTHYAVCGTAADTAEKVVTLPGFLLATGSRVIVRFSISNTAANPTLNVNSTGAKAIRYRNVAISAAALAANRTYEFVYDGAYYQYVGDTDTTYANATQSAAGLMSSDDKKKLDGIAAGAQVNNTFTANQSTDGLMFAFDKQKLDGIQSGAQVNPGDASQGASGLMSATDKQKLDGIAWGAQVNPGLANQGAEGLMSAGDKQKLDSLSTSGSMVPNIDGVISRIDDVSLHANTHYTAPSNGYLNIHCTFQTNTDALVKVSILKPSTGNASSALLGSLGSSAKESSLFYGSYGSLILVPIKRGVTFIVESGSRDALFANGATNLGLSISFIPCE